MICGWCGAWYNGAYCSKYCRNRLQEEAEQNYYRQGPSIDDYYVAMQKDMEEQYERDMQEGIYNEEQNQENKNNYGQNNVQRAFTKQENRD